MKTIVLRQGPFDIEQAFSVGLLAYYWKIFDNFGNDFSIKFIDESDPLLQSEDLFFSIDYIIGLGRNKSDMEISWDKQNKQYFYSKRIHKNNDKGQKTPLSCIGIIYKKYGKQIIQNIIEATPDRSIDLTSKDMNMIFERIYFDFIEVMDSKITNQYQWKYKLHSKHPFEKAEVIAKRDMKFSIDNWYLDSIVRNLNLTWDQEFDQQLNLTQFWRSVGLCMGVFERSIKYLVFTHLGGRNYIQESYDSMLNGETEIKYQMGDIGAMKRILILDKFVSWKEHLHTYEYQTDGLSLGHCLYTVFPDSGNGNSWRVACVPTSPGGLQSRKPLPLKWRGLIDGQLEEISGIKGAQFVHAQGFIGGGTSRETCLKMAIDAINCKD